jgi:hypothetical protein
MARLTETDKKALREVNHSGWIQCAEERSPVIVEPTPENNWRYCKWLSQLPDLPQAAHPEQPTGSNWLL